MTNKKPRQNYVPNETDNLDALTYSRAQAGGQKRRDAAQRKVRLASQLGGREGESYVQINITER